MRQSMTAVLSPESGAQHPGSPGGKADKTSFPQRGKRNKRGRSIKSVLELPGSQGKKGYLIQQIDSTSRERNFFPLSIKFSQRTFILSVNLEASSG